MRLRVRRQRRRPRAGRHLVGGFLGQQSGGLGLLVRSVWRRLPSLHCWPGFVVLDCAARAGSVQLRVLVVQELVGNPVLVVQVLEAVRLVLVENLVPVVREPAVRLVLVERLEAAFLGSVVFAQIPQPVDHRKPAGNRESAGNLDFVARRVFGECPVFVDYLVFVEHQQSVKSPRDQHLVLVAPRTAPPIRSADRRICLRAMNRYS